ncbi:receptor-binding cancer antigen expressed on SiSo cells-like [Montipora capricornis]|uniref:receptor-binding cancer antigen expressed on SiSo cells-like n=1 Tax=Montipora capricornis TaxID=246305 RepID=UPI0035F209D8
MKVVQLNFRRVCSCLTFLIGFIKNILFRRRQRKLSHGENERLPTSVMVTSSNAGNATEQAAGSDEWTEWGQMEEFSVRVEPSSSLTQEQLPANDDLFHDMTPVFQKPKKILVKKKKPFSDGSNAVEAESPSSRLKFDVAYPPAEPELGTWAEESTAWEEDGVSEIDIELQTEKLKKERKQAERERRAMEQQKKREEREAHKIQKPQGHFGVRIAT